MGRTIPRDLQKERRARELYVPGIVTLNDVARILGVSRTTIVRWLNPEYDERQRQVSLKYKQKRRGVCERCGGETRYAGHGEVGGVFRLCKTCNETPWTHCLNGHEYTPETDLRGLPGYKAGGGNSCRICRNEYMRQYQRERYANDPAFREKKRIQNAKRYAETKEKK